MSAARLAEDDAQRPHVSGSSVRASRELGAADDHRQGIIELVAGAAGELAQGLQLQLPQPIFFGYRSC